MMRQCCAGAVVAACEEKDRRIAELERQPVATEDVQIARARRDDALDALRGVLAILDRDGGFRTPKQQAVMRGAKALIAEYTPIRSRASR